MTPMRLAAPGWTPVIWLQAVGLTLASLLLLPLLQQMHARTPEVIPLRQLALRSTTPPPPMVITKPSAPPTTPPHPSPPQPPHVTRVSTPTPAIAFAPVFAPIRGNFSLTVGMPGVVAPGGKPFAIETVDRRPAPLIRLQPLYPASARLRGIEGEVLVEFTVEDTGRTTDPVIIEATPARIFESATLNAIRAWRFEPGTKHGRPVAVRVRQTVSFRLE